MKPIDIIPFVRLSRNLFRIIFFRCQHNTFCIIIQHYFPKIHTLTPKLKRGKLTYLWRSISNGWFSLSHSRRQWWRWCWRWWGGWIWWRQRGSAGGQPCTSWVPTVIPTAMFWGAASWCIYKTRQQLGTKYCLANVYKWKKLSCRLFSIWIAFLMNPLIACYIFPGIWFTIKILSTGS